MVCHPYLMQGGSDENACFNPGTRGRTDGDARDCRSLDIIADMRGTGIPDAAT